MSSPPQTTIPRVHFGGLQRQPSLTTIISETDESGSGTIGSSSYPNSLTTPSSHSHSSSSNPAARADAYEMTSLPRVRLGAGGHDSGAGGAGAGGAGGAAALGNSSSSGYATASSEGASAAASLSSSDLPFEIRDMLESFGGGDPDKNLEDLGQDFTGTVQQQRPDDDLSKLPNLDGKNIRHTLIERYNQNIIHVSRTISRSSRIVEVVYSSK